MISAVRADAFADAPLSRLVVRKAVMHDIAPILQLINSYAANVKMDVAKFKSCIASDKYKAAIDKDIAEGMAAGVNGTPSFVLGRVVDGKLVGVRMVGAMPYEQFDAKIQEMLAQAAAKN